VTSIVVTSSEFKKLCGTTSDVEYSAAPKAGLNGLKATNEKASKPSRDGVDQSKRKTSRSKR